VNSWNLITLVLHKKEGVGGPVGTKFQGLKNGLFSRAFSLKRLWEPWALSFFQNLKAPEGASPVLGSGSTITRKNIRSGNWFTGQFKSQTDSLGLSTIPGILHASHLYFPRTIWVMIPIIPGWSKAKFRIPMGFARWEENSWAFGLAYLLTRLEHNLFDCARHKKALDPLCVRTLGPYKKVSYMAHHVGLQLAPSKCK